MQKIRWGVVGAGRIANTFADDMALVDNATIHAVAARSLAAASKFSDTHRIGKAYQGYEDLYSDPEIDAIYVATPHTLHLQNSIDALNAGKAVLCEKPLTTSATECRVLLDTAAQVDGYLMEAMWTWFLPAIRKAREWVDAGRIGALRHIKADFGYPVAYDPNAREYNATLAGGCLLEMGIYPIAIARYFAGISPGDTNVISHHAPNGVDDDVVVQFDYESYVASLATSFRAKLQNSAYIIGCDAYIEIPNFWRANECHLWELDTRVDSYDDERKGSGFEFQIEAVSNDILSGRKESAIVTHADSLAFQQDMDRVRERFAGD